MSFFKKIADFFTSIFKKSSVATKAPTATTTGPGAKPPTTPAPTPAERPSAKERVLLYYPKAIRPSFEQKTQGEYRDKYPKGLVVHWIWAPQDGDPTFWSQWGRDEGYTFFTMGADGKVVQAFPLNRWGSHAGSSSWPGLSGNVSDELVGIEIVCEGLTTKVRDGVFKNNSRTVPADTVSYFEKRGNIKAGWYQRYTAAQVEGLIELCLWLKRNNPSVFSFDNVVGHDEVAPDRKNDPGGSLGMTMAEFRSLLKARYAKELEA